MVPVSVVIIAKNEARLIAKCIRAVRLITDDIVVIDSGSTDATVGIAQHYGCRVYSTAWKGYGAAKNLGNEHARHNWILSVDADEIADAELVKAIYRVNFNNPNTVYDVAFKTWFGNKQVRFGSWGRDHHVRLFNRTVVKWSELQVHERLLVPKGFAVKKLAGHFEHHSVENLDDYRQKALFYAKLSAAKYYGMGKRSNAVKQYLSPAFSFIKNYIFYLGIADGWTGWQIARTTAGNTWLKYHYLRKMEQQHMQQPVYFNNKLAIEY